MENKVILQGHYGSDLTHALSAWTSTERELDDEKRARIPQLLQKLVEGSDGNSHGTVFEKSFLHFLVTSDVASHIHVLKHRIAVSVNTESARYKELKEDKAYIPTDWPEQWQLKLRDHAAESFKLYHECTDSLVAEYGFDRKRAKESARYFNPYCIQLVQDISFNFRSFVYFCKLRAKPSAQFEIRNIANEMIRLVSEIEGDPFHHSLRAWGLVKDD